MNFQNCYDVYSILNTCPLHDLFSLLETFWRKSFLSSMSFSFNCICIINCKTSMQYGNNCRLWCDVLWCDAVLCRLVGRYQTTLHHILEKVIFIGSTVRTFNLTLGGYLHFFCDGPFYYMLNNSIINSFSNTEKWNQHGLTIDFDLLLLSFFKLTGNIYVLLNRWPDGLAPKDKLCWLIFSKCKQKKTLWP